jgi:hypothetical protein
MNFVKRKSNVSTILDDVKTEKRSSYSSNGLFSGIKKQIVDKNKSSSLFKNLYNISESSGSDTSINIIRNINAGSPIKLIRNSNKKLSYSTKLRNKTSTAIIQIDKSNRESDASKPRSISLSKDRGLIDKLKFKSSKVINSHILSRKASENLLDKKFQIQKNKFKTYKSTSPLKMFNNNIKEIENQDSLINKNILNSYSISPKKSVINVARVVNKMNYNLDMETLYMANQKPLFESIKKFIDKKVDKKEEKEKLMMKGIKKIDKIYDILMKNVKNTNNT